MGLVTLNEHSADFGAGGATWGSCRVRRPQKTAGSHHQTTFQRLIRVISCRGEEARLELREKRRESLPKAIAQLGQFRGFSLRWFFLGVRDPRRFGLHQSRC